MFLLLSLGRLSTQYKLNLLTIFIFYILFLLFTLFPKSNPIIIVKTKFVELNRLLWPTKSYFFPSDVKTIIYRVSVLLAFCVSLKTPSNYTANAHWNQETHRSCFHLLIKIICHFSFLSQFQFFSRSFDS